MSRAATPPIKLWRLWASRFTGQQCAHAGTHPGTWSDDGAQMLALLDSLLTCGRFDADDLGARLVAWLVLGLLGRVRGGRHECLCFA